MKKVLFVCIENSCRSQMAEGFARRRGRGILEVYSAGSKPSGIINPLAVQVMQEVGIDISAQASKGFDALEIRSFDYVITLGCRDVCPFVPAHQHIAWDIEDPKGKGIEFFRMVRNRIEDKVIGLIQEIAAYNKRED